MFSLFPVDMWLYISTFSINILLIIKLYNIYKKEIKAIKDENDILKKYMNECNSNLIELNEIFMNKMKEENNNNLVELIENENNNIRKDINLNSLFYQKQINKLKEKNIINSILINYQYKENIDLQNTNYKIIKKDNKIIVSYITSAKLSKIYTNNLIHLSSSNIEDIINKINTTNIEEILLDNLNIDKLDIKTKLRNEINRNQNDLTLTIENVELIINTKNKTYQIFKRNFIIRKPINDNKNKFINIIKNINNPKYYIDSNFNINENIYYSPFIFTNGNYDVIQIEHYEKILNEKDFPINYYCNCLNAQTIIKEQYMSNKYKGMYV